MGFLPCRRPKRMESNSAEPPLEPQNKTKRTTKNDEGTTVLLIEDEDERVRLQRLSRPSLSSNEDNVSMTPLNGVSSSIQNAKDSVKTKKVEQRRRRLENISGKLRRRLSRDPRWLDPSSKTPEMRKHRVRSLLLSANAGVHRRPSVLDHALGSGLVNENEYDSDAQYISTPKGSIQTGKLSGTKSSNKSPGSLPRERESTIREESEQFGSAMESSDRPRIDNDQTQAGGQSATVEQLQPSPPVREKLSTEKQMSANSSTDEAIGRQAAPEIQSKLSKDSSFDNSGLRSHSSHERERLGQGVSPSPSLHTPVIVHKDSMTLMRARGLSVIKAPDDQTHSNESSCTGDDALSTEIMNIKINGTPASAKSCAGSPSSFSSDRLFLSAFHSSQSHLRSLSESDCVRLYEMNISKRLASASADYPTSFGDQLPLSWTGQQDKSIFRSSLWKGSTQSESVPTMEVPRVNPSENNQRGRNISSLYLSQTSSLPSSYGNSINLSRLEVPPPSYSKDVIVLSKRNGKTRGARRYSALPADLFSPKEDSRTVPADSPLPVVHDSVLQESGTQSKFKEQFEPDSPGTRIAAVECATDTKSTVSRSVSVGWMSGGRRLGYGYAFVPNEGAEGSKAPVSDTLLDDNPTVPAGRPRLGSQRRNHSKELSTDKEKSLLSPNVPPSVDGMAERPFCNDSCAESGEIRELRGRKSRQHSSLRAKTEQLWAKFPSHSRTERSGSATYSDDVIVRDFYFRPDPDDIMRRELGKKERGASGGKSRKFLHRWTKLYRSKSVEARRYRAGFTAEAAKCREPNFPELQIPRGVTCAVPRKEQLGDYREEVQKYEIWMKLRNKHASRVELSNSTSMEGPSTGLQQILVDNESLTRTSGFRNARDSGKENLDQESPSTAQGWSRVYEECLEIPDNEIDQEQQPPVSARDERGRRPTSARGHLPNPDSDLQGAQADAESQLLTG